jgi:hypothetical protein
VALPVCLGVGASISVMIARGRVAGARDAASAKSPAAPFCCRSGRNARAGFALPAAGVVVPALDLLWFSRAAAVITHHQPCRAEVVLSVGYSEPSLVFLLGTGSRLVTAAPADQQLSGACMPLANERDDAAFRRSLGSSGFHPLAIDRVSGLDYSAGGGRVQQR